MLGLFEFGDDNIPVRMFGPIPTFESAFYIDSALEGSEKDRL